MDYRSLPRIANSDLSEFRDYLLFGRQPQARTSSALNFGTRFHEYSLTSIDVAPTGQGAKPITRMLNVLKENYYYQQLISSCVTEMVHCWEDAVTGLPCKARLDMASIPARIIADLKTTSANSQAEFEAHCQRYDYDRQAAYYLDGCRMGNCLMDQFVILGIQKQQPHNLYVIVAGIDSPFIERGRQKYRRLLKSWAQKPYFPSSWNKQAPVEPLAPSPYVFR